MHILYNFTILLLFYKSMQNSSMKTLDLGRDAQRFIDMLPNVVLHNKNIL